MLPRLRKPIVLVDPSPLGYLWRAFNELGPARSTGMGLEAWGWQDVRAFAHEFLPQAEPWEVKALRTMSLSYVGALQASTEALSLSPVQRELGDDYQTLLPEWTPGEAVLISPLELDAP